MEKSKRLDVYIPKSTRSPSPKIIDSDVENSPLHIPCTQDSADKRDVIWDWNSPQTKKTHRKCQKRLLLQSPKVLKRHPSNNSVQDLEKLRSELESLKNELALIDHEESLHLSPVEEVEYKTFNNTSLDGAIQEFPEEFDDLMNEDINEKLFTFSQQIEDKLKSSDSKNSHIKNKINLKHRSPREKLLANDSSDDLLKCIDVNRVAVSLYTGDSQTSNYIYSSSKQAIQTNSGKVEFCRTQSFEIANCISAEIIPKKCSQQEIEHKRMEALAKLESRKKLDKTLVSTQCSMKEIEEKRLQALAKMEAKRQQEIIERKRQEALKRLEIKRQKNAITVRSSLVTRLK